MKQGLSVPFLMAGAFVLVVVLVYFALKVGGFFSSSLKIHNCKVLYNVIYFAVLSLKCLEPLFFFIPNQANVSPLCLIG